MVIQACLYHKLLQSCHPQYFSHNPNTLFSNYMRDIFFNKGATTLYLSFFFLDLTLVVRFFFLFSFFSSCCQSIFFFFFLFFIFSQFSHFFHTHTTNFPSKFPQTKDLLMVWLGLSFGYSWVYLFRLNMCRTKNRLRLKKG